MPSRILRGRTCDAISGISRSKRYELISQGLWTRPIRIAGRSVGWPESEVEALLMARIAEQSDEQIRQLVLRLESARKTAFHNFEAGALVANDDVGWPEIPARGAES